MSHNPLNLGPPVGAGSSGGHTATPVVPETIPHSGVSDLDQAPGNAQSLPTHVKHSRTGSTTTPTNPDARQSQTASDPTNNSEHGSEESSTPTLHSGVAAVPVSAGELHGRPMPSSSMTYGQGPSQTQEKNHQLSTPGGETGGEAASLAKKELGTEERDAFDEKNFKGPPSPTIAMRRIDRTTSGTQAPRKDHNSAAGDTVRAVGMVPITRKTSQPPGVGIFGGVAPSGLDAEEGFAPVRSHEEEEERELRRQEKGPDPWAVKFAEDDKENPKVSRRPCYSQPWDCLLISELVDAVPMVSYRSRWSARFKFYLCLVRSVRYYPRHDCLLWVLAGSRYSHNQSIRRWILYRPAPLGSTIGNIRSETVVYRCIRRLHWFSGRVRAVQEHGIDFDLPVSGRLFRCGTVNQLWGFDCGYMGYRSSRTGDEYLFAGSFCRSVHRAHCGGLHLGHRYREWGRSLPEHLLIARTGDGCSGS